MIDKWRRRPHGSRRPIKKGMIVLVDDFFSKRSAWRHPDTDPRTLGRSGQLLWVAYTPLRILQWQLVPRGHYSYPPRTRVGRVRNRLMRHL